MTLAPKLLVLLVLFAGCAWGYKPIIAMHGFSVSPNAGTARDFDKIKVPPQSNPAKCPRNSSNISSLAVDFDPNEFLS